MDGRRRAGIVVAGIALAVVAVLMVESRSGQTDATAPPPQQPQPVEVIDPATLPSLPAATTALRVYALRDADVGALARFGDLRHLEVGGPAPGLIGMGKLSDAGLEALAGLDSLRELEL
jgi:hypothetical protein